MAISVSPAGDAGEVGPPKSPAAVKARTFFEAEARRLDEEHAAKLRLLRDRYGRAQVAVVVYAWEGKVAVAIQVQNQRMALPPGRRP